MSHKERFVWSLLVSAAILPLALCSLATSTWVVRWAWRGEVSWPVAVGAVVFLAIVAFVKSAED